MKRQDPLPYHFYMQKFEIAFHRNNTGNEFQSFFERLMHLAYKRGDFMACSPWGRDGDRKNDGFLESERRLFQVYAPNEIKVSKTLDKLKEDFEGAKLYWREHFDCWTFVHNGKNRLPPRVLEFILDLRKENPEITIEVWGLEDLQVVFRRLSLDDLVSWFGPAPTEEAKINLGFEDIQVVLESLADKESSHNIPIKDVPPRKIEANALPESVRVLIKSGLSKAPLISDFFDQWHDETLGDRLAAAFREKYRDLCDESTLPNLIFSELQKWVGGDRIDTPQRQMAVLTVLAYYFERCDIFEEPRGSLA